MQEISYENVVQRLLGVIPEFQANEEDVSDHLVHLVFGDLTDFVKSLLETANSDQVAHKVFSFIEEAARSSDDRVLDAVRDSFLEGLADSPDHLHKSKKHMGRSTLKLLRRARAYLKP